MMTGLIFFAVTLTPASSRAQSIMTIFSENREEARQVIDLSFGPHLINASESGNDPPG